MIFFFKLSYLVLHASAQNFHPWTFFHKLNIPRYHHFGLCHRLGTQSRELYDETWSLWSMILDLFHLCKEPENFQPFWVQHQRTVLKQNNQTLKKSKFKEAYQSWSFLYPLLQQRHQERPRDYWDFSVEIESETSCGLLSFYFL